MIHFQLWETRQQKKVTLEFNFSLEADKNNICFVCGNERSEFSKQSIDYNNHIKVDHYPWHYIYFICYLHSKKEKDLNGVEYYVWSQFQEKKPDWIPIGDTLHLRNFLIFLNFLAGDDDHQSDQADEIVEKIKAILVGGFNLLIGEFEKKIDKKGYKVKKIVAEMLEGMIGEENENDDDDWLGVK